MEVLQPRVPFSGWDLDQDNFLELIGYSDEATPVLEHREGCQHDIPEYEGVFRVDCLSLPQEYLLAEIRQDIDVTFEISYGVC